MEPPDHKTSLSLSMSHHDDGLRVNGLCHHVAVMCDVLHHLIKPRPLHLLELEVTQWVADKIKQDTALTQLLDKQLFTIQERGI